MRRACRVLPKTGERWPSDEESTPLPRVRGLSRVLLVVLANESKIAGAEDVLSHTLTLPRLGILVALTLHGQMDIMGRPQALAASAH
jgi:hypothetical protein